MSLTAIRTSNNKLKPWNVEIVRHPKSGYHFVEKLHGVVKHICGWAPGIPWYFPLRLRWMWQDYLASRIGEVYQPDSRESLAELVNEVNLQYRDEINFYLRKANVTQREFLDMLIVDNMGGVI